MADLHAIAEVLSTSKYRFLTDMQIGTLRRLHGASRDEIRTAAIIADRIRRQAQLDAGWNALSVQPVPVDDPIELMKQLPKRRR